jgi:photosystem II stability/assembly factor-like uncharacterized protein
MKRTFLMICFVLISVASFSQWIQQTSHTTKKLRSVCFINENTGLVVGDSGTILKTSDGGTVWTTISSGTTKNLNAVDFPKADTGFVAGEGGIILKTIDGGSTWTTSYSATGLGAFYSVKSQKANKVWVTATGVLLKTQNWGATWYVQTAGVPAPYFAVSFPDTTTGFIYKIPGGAMTFLPVSNTGLYSVFFPDDSTGYAAGMYGTVAVTTNAGNTWNILQHDSGTCYYAVFFSGKNTGYLAGADGLIKKTTNGGGSWIVSPSSTSEELRALYFVNADTGYAVGGNGTILKTTTGGIISAVNKEPAEPVFTIYPNPALDRIQIIPGDGLHAGFRLTLTNLIGKQKSIKDFNNQSAYELDVSSFCKGIYILKIQTDKGAEYKKLVIK